MGEVNEVHQDRKQFNEAGLAFVAICTWLAVFVAADLVNDSGVHPDLMQSLIYSRFGVLVGILVGVIGAGNLVFCQYFAFSTRSLLFRTTIFLGFLGTSYFISWRNLQPANATWQLCKLLGIETINGVGYLVLLLAVLPGLTLWFFNPLIGKIRLRRFAKDQSSSKSHFDRRQQSTTNTLVIRVALLLMLLPLTNAFPPTWLIGGGYLPEAFLVYVLAVGFLTPLLSLPAMLCGQFQNNFAALVCWCLVWLGLPGVVVASIRVWIFYVPVGAMGQIDILSNVAIPCVFAATALNLILGVIWYRSSMLPRRAHLNRLKLKEEVEPAASVSGLRTQSGSGLAIRLATLLIMLLAFTFGQSLTRSNWNLTTLLLADQNAWISSQLVVRLSGLNHSRTSFEDLENGNSGRDLRNSLVTIDTNGLVFVCVTQEMVDDATWPSIESQLATLPIAANVVRNFPARTLSELNIGPFGWTSSIDQQSLPISSLPKAFATRHLKVVGGVVNSNELSLIPPGVSDLQFENCQFKGDFQGLRRRFRHFDLKNCEVSIEQLLSMELPEVMSLRLKGLDCAVESPELFGQFLLQGNSFRLTCESPDQLAAQLRKLPVKFRPFIDLGTNSDALRVAALLTWKSRFALSASSGQLPPNCNGFMFQTNNDGQIVGVRMKGFNSSSTNFLESTDNVELQWLAGMDRQFDLTNFNNENFPELTSLRLLVVSTYAGLSAVNLNRGTIGQLESNCPNLEAIVIDGEITPLGWAEICTGKRVDKVAINPSGLTPARLRQVKQMRQLKTLVLLYDQMTEDEVEETKKAMGEVPFEVRLQPINDLPHLIFPPQETQE